MKYSPELIQKTLDLFQPKYAVRGEVITEQDAVEMLDNMNAFVEILIEMYEKDKRDKLLS